jgi:hypothetical protein
VILRPDATCASVLRGAVHRVDVWGDDAGDRTRQIGWLAAAVAPSGSPVGRTALVVGTARMVREQVAEEMGAL